VNLLPDAPAAGWTGSLESRACLDGGATTIHATAYRLEAVKVRLVRVDPPMPLMEWCASNGVADAITGGFFAKPQCVPLGAHRIGGQPIEHQPFEGRVAWERAALHIDGDDVVIAPLGRLAAELRGDLLQAGPLLVRDGAAIVGEERDPEGFSSDAHLFDQDITKGRLPRAAIALSDRHLITTVADGRSEKDDGLTLPELAEVLVALGASSGMNLDGGSSATLVAGGVIQNRPREDDGSSVPDGRPAPTALIFEPVT
jgi:hypothetical protein